MAKKQKITLYGVNEAVQYNGLPYQVQDVQTWLGINYYLLFNRIGYVQETELKATKKR